MAIVCRSYFIGHKFINPIYEFGVQIYLASATRSCELLKGMTIVYRSYVIGHKFINPIYECGVK